MAAENGGYDQGACVRGEAWPPLRRIMSSPSQTCRRRLVWTMDDRRHHPSRLCSSQLATCRVDNTVDLYAVKPDICPESHFWPTWPAFDAPVRGVPVRYCDAIWYGKTRMVWLPDGEKIWRYVYSFWHDPPMWQTDGQTDKQTDTAWRHRLCLCIASHGKNQLNILGNHRVREKFDLNKKIWFKFKKNLNFKFFLNHDFSNPACWLLTVYICKSWPSLIFSWPVLKYNVSTKKPSQLLFSTASSNCN